MTITHHLDDATLMAYAAGALDEAMSLVVASHLAWCPQCHKAARCGDHLGGALIDEISEEPMSNGALDRIMGQLDTASEPLDSVAVLADHRRPRRPDPASGELPPPLARRLGVPVSEIRWRRIAPGVQTFAVPLSPSASGKLSLMRIAKGVTMPEHGHGGSEMTLVLSGSYIDKFGRFSAGDVADLDIDVEHQPVADSNEDCICLVAQEAPTRFKGIIGRILQPFVGL